jgi:hypothetical protein
VTTQINAPEIHERRQRLLLFGKELDRRGVPHQVSQPSNAHWRLRVHGMQLTVLCAGAEGTYVLVTADGHILANADPSGCSRAADLVTRRLRPAQTRWAS